MRTLATIAIFLILLLPGCLFGASGFVPAELIVALWLLPFLIGATAGVCSRKWGVRAVGIGIAVILIPSAGAMFILRSAEGAKFAGVLAVLAAIPFLGALLMAKLAEKGAEK
jgi:hypothetical protein